MEIRRVIYPSLERTPIRDAICYGALAGRNVPHSRIERFEGRDRLAYDSEEAFCEAAIAEGFTEPFTSYLADGPPDVPNYIVVTWTYLAMLTEVAESDGISLVILDDVRLKKNFTDYEALLDGCPNFDILQVWWWLHVHDAEKPPERTPGDLTRGFLGPGDDFLILTPKGASMILEWIQTYKDTTIEACLHHRMHYTPELLDTCYAVNRPSEYMGHLHVWYPQKGIPYSCTPEGNMVTPIPGDMALLFKGR